MSDTLNLVFPKGEFTHTELAQANGKTNQQVWTAYQKAIKDGVIISAGLRTGKGKPSKLWKVCEGTPVPVVDVVPATPKVLMVDDVPKPVAPALMAAQAPELEHEIEDVQPAAAPVEVVEVKVTLSEPKIDDLKPVSQPAVVVWEQSEFKCPKCGTLMMWHSTPTGVRIECRVSDTRICPPYENVFGHSNNLKNAYQIACDKFGK